jgi:hypothetical protein
VSDVKENSIEKTLAIIENAFSEGLENFPSKK